MADRRKSDIGDRFFMRSDRFFQVGGQWYFNTREGGTEGPYATRAAAKEKLERYISVMSSGWLAPEVNNGLSLVPKS